MVDGDIFKLSEVIQSIKESPSSLLVAVMCDVIQLRIIQNSLMKEL